MKATETQEQIAKELCLKLIENNLFMRPSTNASCTDYNTCIGEQIGIAYQAILAKVVKSTD